MNPKRPGEFSPPWIGDAETEEVLDTLRSGWITTGPKVARFEREFAAYVGTESAVGVSSSVRPGRAGAELWNHYYYPPLEFWQIERLVTRFARCLPKAASGATFSLSILGRKQGRAPVAGEEALL